MRNSLPFISPWPFATTAEKFSRNSFTIAPESSPAGAEIAVKAADGQLGENNFSPNALAAARVIAAHNSAPYTRAAASAAISEVAGVNADSPFAAALRSFRRSK